ncbi:hypothetical protein [Escherichia phage ZCEC12]|uniref:hypothetical protein n=1 Tax=Escherichia phage ZCEC10 TaxID=2894588 RepID=UPI00240E5CDE|nr:hypothetical protein P9622_gp17 [Escherichia phage ZCEC10]UJQ87905.1 hypothetical protein [Escherichia phage ZCEC11]UJQ87942.1 hypothetical protein [Escherichia phage ZCEC12]UJQ88044.1 hypothetical protein [Escherichia phage ZCEC10]
MFNNHVAGFYNLLVVQVAYVRVAVLTGPESLSEFRNHNLLDRIESRFVPVVEE